MKTQLEEIHVPQHVPSTEVDMANRILSGIRLVRRECEPQSAPLTPACLSVPETQRYLGGIGRTTLHEIVKRGDVPAVRIGRRCVFAVADLDRYLRKRKRRGGGAK